MLKRKAENKIRKWLGEGRNALLIEGARQVGKTYIVRKVLREEGADFLEINLIENPEMAIALENSRTTDDFVSILSLCAPRGVLTDGMVIFLDEVQTVKDIVTRIKFLVDEGRFRYILSGSLLGVELRNLRSAPVGYLSSMTLYPLDFEEFLQIYGFTPEVRDSLFRAFGDKVPVDDVVHERMMTLFMQYLVVGGMPEAVETFRSKKSFGEVTRIHTEILETYKLDFSRYEAQEKKLYLRKVYENIPSQLSAKGKRFHVNSVKEGMRAGSEECFSWLVAAGAVICVTNVTEPVIPLRINEKSSLFKLFLSDVGLLSTMYGNAAKLQLLGERKDMNSWAIFENVAAQELRAHGFFPCYFNSKKLGELDFVIERNGHVLPLEIKSGKDYTRHSALSSVMSVASYDIPEAYVFCSGNVSTDGPVTYYPIYMLMFLEDSIVLPEPVFPDFSSLS